MISIIRLFIISFLILLSGCVKNEFSIEFSLPAEVTANYKVSYYASDKRGGLTMETVAPVANGKYTLKGTTVNPALVFLSSPGGQSIALYVKRGETLKISGKSANPSSWSVEGNKIDEEWSEWRKTNSEKLAKADPAVTNSLISKYVCANPDSPLSTLMLLTSFSRKDDEKLFRSLWLKLEGDARNPEWTALAGRADQPGPDVKTPARLRSMAVRSLHHGVDTIRTDSAKATILFFWHSGLRERREHFDSIKTIAKEFPDSASRVIADICLDADSIAWRSPLRSDSLSNVVRAWAPAGLADSKIMALYVPRSPYYIVFSPDGSQRYRGSDTKDALAEFRKLMGK